MIDITKLAMSEESTTEEVDDKPVYPEAKPFVDIFKSLYCKECDTHLNGGTICPNCGAHK